MLALDPVYTLGQQIVEVDPPPREASPRPTARARALALFERVRIPSPERRLDAYPHEMSGGMRQRAMIALALACRPQRAAGRRAHDGARRHGADPDPAAPARAAARPRAVDHLRHARSRRRGGGRRPHRRDVCGPHRREGSARDVIRARAIPIRAGCSSRALERSRRATGSTPSRARRRISRPCRRAVLSRRAARSPSSLAGRSARRPWPSARAASRAASASMKPPSSLPRRGSGDCFGGATPETSS